MGVKYSQLPVASEVAANDYIALLDSSEGVLKRTQITHASEDDAYGLGTASLYGHNKVVDSLDRTNSEPGEALSAHTGTVLATNISNVEATNIAQNPYSVGDYFMWGSADNKYVRVTAAIREGDTIAFNTNVAPAADGKTLVSETMSNAYRFADSMNTQTKEILNPAFKTGSLVDVYYREPYHILPTYQLQDGKLTITLKQAPEETIYFDIKVVN